MPYPSLLHSGSLPLQISSSRVDTQKQFWLHLCGVSGSWYAQGLYEPSELLWWVWGLILNAILPHLSSCWGFSFAFGVGCLFLVGSNILLSMVVKQLVVILEFSQKKMSTCHSTPSSCRHLFLFFLVSSKILLLSNLLTLSSYLQVYAYLNAPVGNLWKHRVTSATWDLEYQFILWFTNSSTPSPIFQPQPWPPMLKDNAVKVLRSICQQICKTQQWPQDWKRSIFIPIPKKDNIKESSNYHTIALISHAS